MSIVSKVKLNTSLENMIQDYINQTKKFGIEGEVVYLKDKGFVTYIIKGDSLMIPDLYGSGIFWLGIMEKFAKLNNCKKLVGGTSRNPKAYNKMFGTKTVGYILEKEL